MYVNRIAEINHIPVIACLLPLGLYLGSPTQDSRALMVLPFPVASNRCLVGHMMYVSFITLRAFLSAL